jgi:integrase
METRFKRIRNAKVRKPYARFSLKPHVVGKRKDGSPRGYWIKHRFSRICAKAHIECRGFYVLRHTLETEAGRSRDQVAVDTVMGHARGDLASMHYRHGVRDDGLADMSQAVHKRLSG